MRSLTIACVLLALVLLGLSIRTDAHEGSVIAGVVSAADHEALEGYFAIGQETAVVVKPGSGLHQWLNGHKGQRVTLKIETETATDSH